MPSPILISDNLPNPAVPFVRELLLEISRRIPTNLGTPPRFDPADLDDAERCARAVQGLVRWFDTMPDGTIDG